jgi:hypothetical protein
MKADARGGIYQTKVSAAPSRTSGARSEAVTLGALLGHLFTWMPWCRYDVAYTHADI